MESANKIHDKNFFKRVRNASIVLAMRSVFGCSSEDSPENIPGDTSAETIQTTNDSLFTYLGKHESGFLEFEYTGQTIPDSKDDLVALFSQTVDTNRFYPMGDLNVRDENGNLGPLNEDSRVFAFPKNTIEVEFAKELRDKKLGPLTSLYFGIDKVSKDGAETIDPQRQLLLLRQIKFGLLWGYDKDGRKKADFIAKWNTLTEKKNLPQEELDELQEKEPYEYFFITQVLPYITGEKKFTPSSMETLVHDIDSQVTLVKENTDRESMRGLIKKDRETFAINIMKDIDKEVILTYLLTELGEYAGKDAGPFNYATISTMQSYATEYLNLITATGDDAESHGLYQFTEYGREQIEKVQRKCIKQPAKANHPLYTLDSKNAHRAAIINSYFIIYNIINGLEKEEYNMFVKRWSKLKKDQKEKLLSQLLPMGHNSPTRARKALVKFIKNGFQSSMYKNGLTEIQRNYGWKAKTNKEAIDDIIF